MNRPGAMAAMRRGSAVAVVDLLHFRDRVNYPHGHLVGDRVLQEVAARLRDGLTPLRVYRHGGDEFAIEIDGPLDATGAGLLAARVAELVGMPIAGLGAPLEARVGITLRRIEDDLTSVLGEAEQAAVAAAMEDVPFVVARRA